MKKTVPNNARKPELSDNAKITLLTIAVLLVLFVIAPSFYVPQLEKEMTFHYKEQPLEKNSALQLKNGEKYSYDYMVEGLGDAAKTTSLTYEVRQYGKCKTIVLKEIKLNESTQQPCLKQDGTDQNGSNLTISNPFILMFKPWMLAVKEGWVWKVELRADYGPGNITIEQIKMRYAGTETYLNRTVYVVDIIRNGNKNDKITSWIDKEKRVLLKENGMAYSIEIKEAPFLD